MTSTTERRFDLDYLRAAAIVLVVWHHAIIPYTTFAYLNPLAPAQTISPVVNGERWAAFDTLAWFNDLFLMPLLFLVSGLFVWRSLERRGATGYLAARIRRLGIPFLFGVVVLVPITYYPAQLQISRAFGSDTGFLEFSVGLLRSGFGTAGPLWFVWVLLVFNILFVSWRWLARDRTTVDNAQRRPLLEKPIPFFGALLLLSGFVYLPMEALFGPSSWMGFGPFVLQTSRIFLYLVYFTAGVALGKYGLELSLFRKQGPLSRHWVGWLLAAAASFAATVSLTDLVSPVPIVGGIMFTLCAVALSGAAAAVFVRFATRRSAVLDNLAHCSYGIYIVHYAIVTWLQFGMLSLEIPAPVKAMLAFAGTLLLSWGAIAALRRFRPIARVI